MSFRPIEEHGRNLPTRSRNDLIHVDAFPNRPARDRRILRFFANLNHTKPRVWKIADINFELLAQRLAVDAGPGEIPPIKTGIVRPPKRLAREALRYGGYRAAKYSLYDRFMLRFHDYLKLNTNFQDACPKDYFEFPAGSAWILFTDMVPHAAISGQYALEQTFFLPVSSMLCPEKSPLRILEAIGGRILV